MQAALPVLFIERMIVQQIGIVALLSRWLSPCRSAGKDRGQAASPYSSLVRKGRIGDHIVVGAKLLTCP
jgi:hypothetical protein